MSPSFSDLVLDELFVNRHSTLETFTPVAAGCDGNVSVAVDGVLTFSCIVLAL
jgi:hypothetical protein